MIKWMVVGMLLGMNNKHDPNEPLNECWNLPLTFGEGHYSGDGVQVLGLTIQQLVDLEGTRGGHRRC